MMGRTIGVPEAAVITLRRIDIPGVRDQERKRLTHTGSTRRRHHADRA
jgi:hypothetical protein